MELIYILLVLLVVTRACGELAERLGQPALVGEVVAGIGLGVVIREFSGTFPVLAGLPDNEVFGAIADLGVFFLMLLGGVELQPHRLVRTSSRAGAVAVGGFVVPLTAGFGLAWVFLPTSDVRMAQALFVGTALAITAVPVAIKILMDLGHLQSDAGQTIVSAAVVDDVLSLLLLAVLTGVLRTGSVPDVGSLLLLAGQIVLFFAVTIPVGYFLLPRVMQFIKRARIAELEFSVLFIAALAFGWLAEALGMHFILGPFLAGLYFGRRTVDDETFHDVQKKVSAITTGFLAPLFFASIGLHVTFGALTSTPVFLVLLIGVAFVGKLLGAGLPAWRLGLSRTDAAGVGLAMSARGAVELVIADIALAAGLFSQPEPVPAIVANLFSAVVIVAVVTTVVTPMALRTVLGRD